MQDINQAVENPNLVVAIEAIQKEINQDTQNDFFNAIKDAKYLTPVHIDPPISADDDGKATLQTDTIISFVNLEDSNGDIFLPMYTDWAALKQWRDVPDEKTMILSYNDVRALITDKGEAIGFVINPYTHNIPIRENTMKILDAGPVEQWTAEENTQVRIGQPENDPVEIKEAISDHLKNRTDVSSAYLVLMENNEEFSYLIIVDFTGDQQEVFTDIASVAVPLLREGELIDMAPADSDLGRSVAQDFSPFYEKKAE